MRIMKIAQGAIAFLPVLFSVSCADHSRKSERQIKEENKKCPILFNFGEGQFLDLRKPWNAVRDAENHMKNGRRILIVIPSKAAGYRTPHDYKYSSIWTNIINSDEKLIKKCKIDVTGIGSLEGIRYKMAHPDEDVCMDQNKNMEIYSEQYNNYVFNNIANDPNCRELLRE
ncbi:hypothetical protein [Sphingomonas alpina]|uniref:Lipoprotein n=1 Tax=Sphingomonas alpina TaxID=653931 RepID=A0A7H0LES0_9SPHN|nr:hypothetical protein [Sphingomonas alpina]QNQ08173.1 hypothetical protein H3Z74_15545 [Sphingomonas alpina]